MLDPHLNLNGDLNKCRSIPVGCAQWTLTVDAKQVAHKNYKLSMSFGKSRHYKIKEIAVRHIIETGVEAGLSRQSIAEIFDQLCKDKDKAIEHTLQGLPKDFPQNLLDSNFTTLEKNISLLNNAR